MFVFTINLFYSILILSLLALLTVYLYFLANYLVGAILEDPNLQMLISGTISTAEKLNALVNTRGHITENSQPYDMAKFFYHILFQIGKMSVSAQQNDGKSITQQHSYSAEEKALFNLLTYPSFLHVLLSSPSSLVFLLQFL